MKRILITAAGVVTVWHMVNVIEKYFSTDYEIHLCDINPEELVPASVKAYKFHQVPLSISSEYYGCMLNLLEREKIDIIVPLLNRDLELWSSDNEDLKRLNVITTGPIKSTYYALDNKETLYYTLMGLELPCLKLYKFPELEENAEYIVKPKIGGGAKGVMLLKGREISESDFTENVVQRYCKDTENYGEITAEVYNYKGVVRIIQRRRVAIRQGVCTKAVRVYYDEIDKCIKKLISKFECPVTMCIQFLYDGKHWCMNDCNLRLGAGTALSTGFGFELVRAMLATLADGQPHPEYLEIDDTVKAVVRVYDEIVMR